MFYSTFFEIVSWYLTFLTKLAWGNYQNNNTEKTKPSLVGGVLCEWSSYSSTLLYFKGFSLDTLKQYDVVCNFCRRKLIQRVTISHTKKCTLWIDSIYFTCWTMYGSTFLIFPEVLQHVSLRNIRSAYTKVDWETQQELQDWQLIAQQ